MNNRQIFANFAEIKGKTQSLHLFPVSYTQREILKSYL